MASVIRHRPMGLVGRFRLLATVAWLMASMAVPLAAGPVQATDSGQEYGAAFGGPSSVDGQLSEEHQRRHQPYHFSGFSAQMQPYYDFQSRLGERHGFTFGGDYNALIQGASDSLGEDRAAAGIVRLYSNWTLVGRGTPDSGALVFKVENRHTLGTDIAPQALAGELGYVGLTAVTYSDAGNLLTNLYWQQSFLDNSLALVAGIVDNTDYIDVYGLVNPWTNFNNLVFSTSPTIPVPNQGMGAALRGVFADNFYVLAGVSDSNGDPGDPRSGFDTFFGDRETFKHIELGWFSSWQNRFDDNIHLTAWQVDERDEAGVRGGYGAALSLSKRIASQWLPFLRFGYSDGGGGALLERVVSTGFGFFPHTHSDALGVGLSWGKPSKETFGPGLDDQVTAEVFYRIQLFQHLTVTPDIQYLVKPALNPDDDRIWVLGLRARLTL